MNRQTDRSPSKFNLKGTVVLITTFLDVTVSEIMEKLYVTGRDTASMRWLGLIMRQNMTCSLGLLYNRLQKSGLIPANSATGKLPHKDGDSHAIFYIINLGQLLCS
jgi:hypothetical protein